MNKYFAIFKVLVLLSIFSCVQKGSESITIDKSAKENKIELNQGKKLLSEARERMKLKVDSIKMNGNDPSVLEESIITPNEEEINTSNSQKLSLLSQKSDYNAQDIEQFLEIKPISFKNNAEISQIYNEVLFRIIDKEPKKFVEKSISAPEETKEIINVQIKSPVNDRLDSKKVMPKMQQEVQQQWLNKKANINSQNEKKVLDEYKNYKSLYNAFDEKKKQLLDSQDIIKVRNQYKTYKTLPNSIGIRNDQLIDAQKVKKADAKYNVVDPKQKALKGKKKQLLDSQDINKTRNQHKTLPNSINKRNQQLVNSQKVKKNDKTYKALNTNKKDLKETKKQLLDSQDKKRVRNERKKLY